MLKEIIKIQVTVLLIIVMNAVATKNLKFIGSGMNSPTSVKVQKNIQKDESKQIAQTKDFIINPPRNILLNALKKSLN